MTIQLYTLPSVPRHLAAHHIEDGRWEIFPSVQGGYAARRPWPTCAMQGHILTAHNGIEHIYRAQLAEIPHQARWMGLPDGSTAPIHARKPDQIVA